MTMTRADERTFWIMHPLQTVSYCYPWGDISLNWPGLEVKQHRGPTYLIHGINDDEKTSSFSHFSSPYQYLLVFTGFGTSR